MRVHTWAECSPGEGARCQLPAGRTRVLYAQGLPGKVFRWGPGGKHRLGEMLVSAVIKAPFVSPQIPLRPLSLAMQAASPLCREVSSEHKRKS